MNIKKNNEVDIMEFKEYFKEQIKKVDNDDDLLLLIYFDDTIQFKYHKDCFADMQEDFCILYDDDVNMSFRYDSIRMLQCGNIQDMKKELAENLIKSIMEGISK